jgi:hypothetical protein
MNGSHVERMAEDEIDLFISAEVSQPVPGEHALAADHQTITIGLDLLQKVFRPRRDVLVKDDFASCIEDAEVHGVGMQIDAALKPVLFCVEFHGAGSFL